MTDNLKESLSALMDDEASEIEVHRLLRQFHEDDRLRPSWVSYHQVRAVVRGENVLSVERHLDLHARISREIDGETTHSDSTPLRSHNSYKRYLAPATGLAVAASLVVAVFVGFNLQSGQSETEVATTVAFDEPRALDEPRAPVTNTASMASAEQSEFFDSGELRELDPEKQRKLRDYLNQHDRMARLNPNVRTVTFDQPKNK